MSKETNEKQLKTELELFKIYSWFLIAITTGLTSILYKIFDLKRIYFWPVTEQVITKEEYSFISSIYSVNYNILLSLLIIVTIIEIVAIIFVFNSYKSIKKLTKPT
ncbi:MAG: hypothetical protein IIA88_02970 [Bacteroidetes bacterium]|nr:hypothetical protein [Bacteroidota bacterium]